MHVTISIVEQLSSQQLARLLKPNIETDWTKFDGEAALRHQLEAPLLPDLLFVNGIDTKKLAASLRDYSGPLTFGTQLNARSPSLGVLLAIKHFGEQVRQQPWNPLAGDAARFLSLAAIASALARHSRRISEKSDVELAAGFAWAKAHPGGRIVTAIFDLGTIALADCPRSIPLEGPSEA